MPAARHDTLIDASPDQVMAVITDFESYPKFLPEMETARIIKRDGDVWDVAFSVRIVRSFSYTLQLRRVSPTQLKWHLVEGAFKVNEGGWNLDEVDDGARTKAVYTIDLQLGMFVPGNILRSLVERSLPDTVSRFKGETERRVAVGA
jgi:coenzyme Q-binding protein COQ10